MALAIIITLQKDLPDAESAYLKASPGKALARESDRLDFAAGRCHVTAITGMLSENPAVLAKQMQAEGFDPSKMRLPQEQWFVAADGLHTIRELIKHVTANLNDFKFPNPILRDLRAAEALLTTADSGGVGFHFTKTNL